MLQTFPVWFQCISASIRLRIAKFLGTANGRFGSFWRHSASLVCVKWRTLPIHDIARSFGSCLGQCHSKRRSPTCRTILLTLATGVGYKITTQLNCEFDSRQCDLCAENGVIGIMANIREEPMFRPYPTSMRVTEYEARKVNCTTREVQKWGFIIPISSAPSVTSTSANLQPHSKVEDISTICFVAFSASFLSHSYVSCPTCITYEVDFVMSDGRCTQAWPFERILV